MKRIEQRSKAENLINIYNADRELLQKFTDNIEEAIARKISLEGILASILNEKNINQQIYSVLVEILLIYGVDINDFESESLSPLMSAVLKKNTIL